MFLIVKLKSIIAAKNSSRKAKAEADIVCSGENDAAVIQEALDSAGKLTLLEGTYYIGERADIPKRMSGT